MKLTSRFFLLLAAPLLLVPSAAWADGGRQCRSAAPSGAPVRDSSGGGILHALNFGGNTDFCSRPVATLCNSPGTNSTARSQNIDKAVGKALGEALVVTAIRFGRNAATFRTQDVDAAPEPLRTNMTRFLQAQVSSRLSDTIVQADIQGVFGSFGKIKDYVLKAIDRNFAPGSAENTALRARIQSVEVVTRESLSFMHAGPHAADTEALSRGFAEVCGPAGLTDNAFQVPPINGHRYLVVCPGKVLAGIKDGGDVEGSYFRNLVRTVGHELGHHMDSGDLPSIYAKMLDCLADHHAGEMNDTPANSGLTGIDPASLRQARARTVATHAREITADFWGSETLTEYLWDDAHRMDPEQRLRVLREAGGALCGSQDEGIHPTGDFRLTQLMRGNPHLAVTMGCNGLAMPDGKPSCSLAGAVKPGERTLLPLH